MVSSLKRLLMISIAESNGFESAPFLSDRNLEDYDAIFWDAASVYAEVIAYERNYGHIAQRLRARLQEMEDFYKRGGKLIVPVVPTHLLASLGQQSLSKQFPLNLLSIRTASGMAVEYCGSAPAPDEEFVSDLNYAAIIGANDLIPMFCTPRTKELVGGCIKNENGGLILFLPAIDEFKEADRDNELEMGYYARRAKDFLELIPDETFSTDYQNPGWAAEYLLPAEIEAKEKTKAAEERLQAAELEISHQRSLIAAQEGLKRLFTAQGDDLEAAVKDALLELGATLVVGPPRRADLIGLIANVPCVVEIKGQKHSAKESDLRQCIAWMNEAMAAVERGIDGEETQYDLSYIEQFKTFGVQPNEDGSVADFKGLLVVNTYRESELQERVGKTDFPQQVIDLARKSGVCLMTGIQLLGALLQLRSGALTQDAFLSSLLAANGQHPDYRNWQEFIVQE